MSETNKTTRVAVHTPGYGRNFRLVHAILSDAIEKGNHKIELIEVPYSKITDMENKINTLFEAIKHGEPAHQQWLKDKINEHFGLKQQFILDEAF